jgi:hypothetical protein
LILVIVGPTKEGWARPKKYIVRLTDGERETLLVVTDSVDGLKWG